MSEELVNFFKALADSNRLKIVGLLAEKPYSVEELAALLNLKPSTISHHLARLAEVELVSSHTESYYNVYQLDKRCNNSPCERRQVPPPPAARDDAKWWRA